jgi:citrate synthase
MDKLKTAFYEKATATIAEIKPFLKEQENTIIDQVTIGQVFGGMRDIKSMLWETSLLDAQEGIRFRGFSIPDLQTLVTQPRRRAFTRGPFLVNDDL